jgi:hypothetical protein
VGCRHPEALPLAFRVSAQFDGLAHMSMPTYPTSSHMRRRTKGACRSWLIGRPPTRPARHTLGILMRTAKRDSGGDIRCPRSRDLHPIHPHHPVKSPLKSWLARCTSGLPRNLLATYLLVRLRMHKTPHAADQFKCIVGLGQSATESSSVDLLRLMTKHFRLKNKQ